MAVLIAIVAALSARARGIRSGRRARLHRLEPRAGRLPLERSAEPARQLRRRRPTSASTGRSARCTGASTTSFPFCDDNNVFSLTYLRVTEDIRNGIDEGFYPDKHWINYLDAIFARTYFLGYDNYMAGRIDLVPPAWRIAFDAGRNESVKGIGNLLLSMNAHINRDFPFVLYQAGGRPGRTGPPARTSTTRGNARLRALYKPMITELTERFDESIDDYDIPGTEADDEALFSVLVEWRETAWQNALRLAAAKDDAERRQVGQSIEDYAVDHGAGDLRRLRLRARRERRPARRALHAQRRPGRGLPARLRRRRVRIPQGDPARGPDVHLRGQVPRRTGALRRRGVRRDEEGDPVQRPAGKDATSRCCCPAAKRHRRQIRVKLRSELRPGGHA